MYSYFLYFIAKLCMHAFKTVSWTKKICVLDKNKNSKQKHVIPSILGSWNDLLPIAYGNQYSKIGI